MPPEPVCISSEQIDRLCPFHLVVNNSHADLQLTYISQTLDRLGGGISCPCNFSEYFEVTRPRSTTLNVYEMAKSTSTIVIKHKFSPLSLRGLFIPLGNKRFLYNGGIQLTSSDGLQELGLTLKDFSPADTTPDIAILHRFRELQLRDQQTQIEELRKLVAARDKYDRYANTDMLTGIGNRRMFWKKFTDMLNTDSSDRAAAVILLDLDEFKKINDDHGHDVGDQVLKMVASRCKGAVGSLGIVCRLGGDEFVVLVRQKTVVELEMFTEHLKSLIAKPMIFFGRQLHIQPSIGVSLLSSEQTTEEAIHYADLAMYEGRKTAKGRVSWFTPAMQDAEKYRKSIVLDLPDAIENGQIIPFYQPIIAIDGQGLHGYEALARWQHPIHGLTYPDTFIELAAEARCLHKIDYAILEAALNQLMMWDDVNPNLTIHVNLCGTSVRKGLDARVIEMLEERNIRPSRLTLELTETTLLKFGAEEKNLLHRLFQYGVNFALDDFGTGYSCLTHLHEFPVSELKIDRSFLLEFPAKERCMALICSVLEIARGLNLSVVTEGIESAEQLNWLASIGSEYGQGYLFGKPMPASDCNPAGIYNQPSLRKVG